MTWCGDGEVQKPEEDCDDGNNVDGDGCSNSCEIESKDVCGDGKKTGAEECDDGNTKDGDGCSATCTKEAAPADVCGDGKMTGAEECDDGNTKDGDGCSATCTKEKADPPPKVDTDGDGVIDSEDNCVDDPNTDQQDWDGNGIGDVCQDEELLVTGGACSAGQGVGGSGAVWLLLLLAMAGLLVARRRRFQGLGRMCLGALAFMVVLPFPAQAAQIDVQNFHPSPFMHDLVAGEKGAAAANHPWSVGLIANYQLNPLVLRLRDAKTDEFLREIVHHHVTANLLGGVRIFDWLAVGIDVPVVAYQAGETFGTFDDPSSASLGDVAVNPRLRLLSNEDGSFQLAATARITAPTGKLTDAYNGRSGFAAHPGLLASVDWGRFGVVVDATMMFAAKERYANLDFSHTINGRAGLWVVAAPDKFDVMVELTGSTQLMDLFGAVEESPLELLVAGKWHINPTLDMVVGAGTGLTQGAGSPDLRVLAGLMYGPADPVKKPAPKAPPKPKDTDGDGITDDKDKCPKKAEDKDNWQDEDGCPDPDNDGDGILDKPDKCPDVAEDKDNVEDEDGCPEEDNDKDKICDPWVGERGKHADYVKKCKGVDKCPNKPEVVNSYQDDDGCPDQAVKVEAKKVVILQRVHFYFDTNRIKEESFPLLNEVVKVLKENPQLQKLRVEGHTDERGKAGYNIKLSGNHAKAVVEYIVDRGVDKKRLVSKGYGKKRPLVKNAATDEDHLKNRRVEFVIIKQAKTKKKKKKK